LAAFAGLLILALLGIGLYAIFSLIESRVTGGAHRKDEFALGSITLLTQAAVT
jgi:NitT/TauT family transport system permease protein